MRIGMMALISVLFIASGSASMGMTAGGQPGRPAAEFSLASLDGRRIDLAALKGKVAVLDFWATWCEPCQEALPHLQAMAADGEMGRRGLEVLAIDEQEKPDVIRSFIESRHFTFTVLQDSGGSTGQDYSVAAIPTTIVIGRDGLVQAVFNGWTPESAHAIDQAVDHALNAAVH